MSVYLDANASETLRPEALSAMLSVLDRPGNPSSVHAAGRAARRVLEEAREAVARRCGAKPAQVVFTSGGTEADALAVHALGRGRRLVIGATEHDAIRSAAVGADVLGVDADGVVDLPALPALLDRPALVCVMLANNETGTLQPIARIAAICREFGAWLHVDAAQAVGRMAVDFHALGADSLALSGHKLGGPPGAGALIVADRVPLVPLIAGGGQERGWRGGTHALPAIAGLGAAIACPPVDLAGPRDRLERAAVAAGAVVLGAGAARLGNTTCLALPGVAAQTQVMTLDLAGIAVSAGAACSSGKVARSHVLDAMGAGVLAGQAIRVSLPWNVTDADIDSFIAAYQTMAGRLFRSAA
jgi:cysteine desulfurase